MECRYSLNSRNQCNSVENISKIIMKSKYEKSNFCCCSNMFSPKNMDVVDIP